MEERLQRLEKATSYLESFLDVLRRCEVLAKDEEQQYEAYRGDDVEYWCIN